MTTAFIASVAALSVLIVLRVLESSRSERFLDAPRRILDNGVVAMSKFLGHQTKRFLRFAHSDVLMNGLHMVTYAALVCVRYLERKLVALAGTLRRFRKAREPREPSQKLAHIRHTKHSGTL